MADSRNAYRVLVWRPEGKRPLGKPRHRWKNVKMDLQEVGWDRDWLDLAQDRDKLRAVVNATMNIELRFTQLSALESLFFRTTHPEMHEA
jgi:hypothetical protein